MLRVQTDYVLIKFCRSVSMSPTDCKDQSLVQDGRDLIAEDFSDFQLRKPTSPFLQGSMDHRQDPHTDSLVMQYCCLFKRLGLVVYVKVTGYDGMIFD